MRRDHALAQQRTPWGDRTQARRAARAREHAGCRVRVCFMTYVLVLRCCWPCAVSRSCQRNRGKHHAAHPELMHSARASAWLREEKTLDQKQRRQGLSNRRIIMLPKSVIAGLAAAAIAAGTALVVGGAPAFGRGHGAANWPQPGTASWPQFDCDWAYVKTSNHARPVGHWVHVCR
jgi:hypothetical protein